MRSVEELIICEKFARLYATAQASRSDFRDGYGIMNSKPTLHFPEQIQEGLLIGIQHVHVLMSFARSEG